MDAKKRFATMAPEISIFDYTDYRCFLKDLIISQKAKRSSFSFRSFNRVAGIQSSGFLKLVVDGKRNLAEDGIRKIAKGFKFPEGEGRYFETLVRFNQAKTHEEKNHYFKNLAVNMGARRAKTLMVEQYDLFSHWYYVAILEAVRLKSPVSKTDRWLTRVLKPAVGLRQVKKAVQDLKRLGFLNEGKYGALTSREGMLTTPDEVRSLAVTNFHVQMSELAMRAVENDPAQDREFSALTVAVSQAGFEQVKKEISEFRKKIHSILEKDSKEGRDSVAQVNFQLFKLTHKELV